jgi:predicted dehydrogenase
MMDVWWGFAGAGNVTEAKASPGGAFAQDRSRVVAVARTDLACAEAYAHGNGIARAYGSVEELCADPEVNAVFVCTPHHLHAEHALAAIRAGKHVLCEKPLTITTEDGAAVVEAARAAGVVLAVAYYRRFYPVLEKLREVVESGQLGTLTSAQMVCRSHSIPPRWSAATSGRPSWRTSLELAGGGALTDVGSHRLDLLVWLLGDARSVSATVERFETWLDGEDQANVTIQFANRVSAHLDQSWCSRAARLDRALRHARRGARRRSRGAAAPAPDRHAGRDDHGGGALGGDASPGRRRLRARAERRRRRPLLGRRRAPDDPAHPTGLPGRPRAPHTDGALARRRSGRSAGLNRPGYHTPGPPLPVTHHRSPTTDHRSSGSVA